jgi:hypothetical protein
MTRAFAIFLLVLVAAPSSGLPQSYCIYTVPGLSRMNCCHPTHPAWPAHNAALLKLFVLSWRE